ncbi:hypothetical protein ZOSMA_228G00040 [Zostera marina]|uniref:Uncharacterized protein n=1 Tax=Zostera marina TaxID=29655 RepID=A0A0K9PKV0_ZOSMR|nr:hypothetical protein ZOSMA_228G00040 [Zostera marina]
MEVVRTEGQSLQFRYGLRYGLPDAPNHIGAEPHQMGRGPKYINLKPYEINCVFPATCFFFVFDLFLFFFRRRLFLERYASSASVYPEL